MNNEQFQALCLRIANGDKLLAMKELQIETRRRFIGYLEKSDGNIQKSDADAILNETYLGLSHYLDKKWKEEDLDFFEVLNIGLLWKILKRKRISFLQKNHQDKGIRIFDDQVIKEISQKIVQGNSLAMEELQVELEKKLLDWSLINSPHGQRNVIEEVLKQPLGKLRDYLHEELEKEEGLNFFEKLNARLLLKILVKLRFPFIQEALQTRETPLPDDAAMFAISPEDQENFYDNSSLIEKICIQQVYEAIKEIPNKTQRDMLVLRYVEDQLPSEIARQFGCTQQNVNYHIKQAVISLQNSLRIKTTVS